MCIAVFHRYHEAGITRINEALYGTEAKTCQKIWGLDCMIFPFVHAMMIIHILSRLSLFSTFSTYLGNALYLYAIMQEMPTGPYQVRRASNNFIKEPMHRFGHLAYEYLSWMGRDKYIRHKFNNYEARLGERGLPVDGLSGNEVFQFMGCRWHGHMCDIKGSHDVIKRRNNKNKWVTVSAKERRKETDENSAYIRSLGYELNIIWECQWMKQKEESAEIASHIANMHKLHPASKMSQKSVLNAIKSKKIFGLVECDIHCPDNLKPTFEEFLPIFRNTDISLSDVGEHMANYAREMITKPRRALISSFKGIYVK